MRKNRAYTIVVMIVVVGFTWVSVGQAREIVRSGPAQTALIEVYSSEGCSSCVPAWTWLNHVQKHSGLWENFVPVDFHVDYWDYLGWKDELAESRFSNRQRVYAAFWRRPSVYTPGFILNGEEWRGWLAPTALSRLPNGANVGNISVDLSEWDTYRVTFDPTDDSKRTAYDVYIALLVFDLFSDIKAGENRGRLVEHDFTVVDLKKLPMDARSSKIFQAEITLPFHKTFADEKKGIAVWVTQRDQLVPIQAAGAYL